MRNDRQPVLGMRRLDELFSDFKLCKQIILPNRGGSTTDSPKGYKFVGGLRSPGNRDGSVCYINKKTYFLYGKPTQLAIDTAGPNMMEGPVESFEIIKWEDKALVLGRDRVHIGTAWIAFIPLDDIPDVGLVELYPQEDT